MRCFDAEILIYPGLRPTAFYPQFLPDIGIDPMNRTGMPRVSVIICTLNRAALLKRILEGLRRQTYPIFEVIVVNGPSTDETDAVLNEFAAYIQIGVCPDRNVSAARNVGIKLAQGEILAFTDDDAVPDPKWLDNLVAPYSDPNIAGAGGSIFDATAGRMVFVVCVCTRAGDVSLLEEFSEAYVQPGADPVLYLTGGNMSFRRSVLSELGGFDERYPYGYEDVDLGCRLIDAGKKIAIAPDALVNHYPASNVVRDSRGLYRDLYPFIQARTIFALRGTIEPIHEQDAMSRLDACVLSWRNVATDYLHKGILDQTQHDFFVQRLFEAVADGIAIAKLPPRIPKFAHPGSSGFQPFPLSPAAVSG
jgi:glycosyltransferase involved in cell wall biosynthesis